MDTLGITFLLLHTIYYGTCSIFLHEPSSILFMPSSGGPKSEFGFAMGYQYGEQPKLVIGAPRDTYVGKVFSCPMKESLQDLTGPNVTCSNVDIDLEGMSGASRDQFPEQNYYFGGSVVGTKDYFLTCAPLITSPYKLGNKQSQDLFGTCIVYNDTAYQYLGTFEQHQKVKENNNLISFIGGAGWSTLVDEVNGLLIIMKTGLNGDITFVPLQDPLKATTSVKLTLPLKQREVFLNKYRNVGFGITSGKFFNDQTMYAYSLQTSDMKGAVAFLKYKEGKLSQINVKKNKLLLISDNTVGSMFGTALFSADLNLDGFSDILIGAPTHIDKPQESETGAVHICVGGDFKAVDSSSRMFTILGTKDFARFGAALAASDIDGDGLPEIFIGAPYEDSGNGKLYVLSGMEVYDKFFKQQKTHKILISDLTKTQIIKSNEQSQFGYSLQVVPDRDSNGCKELAVGAPGSGVVNFYRCIPTIEVAVSANLIGDPIVKETADDFTMKVCVNVSFPMKPEKINLDLEVNTNVGIGDKAKSQKPIYNIDVTKKNNETTYCDNVTVILTDKDPGIYTFKAQIDISEKMKNKINTSKEFDNSWVLLSPRSKTTVIRKIERNCGDDCRPIWNVTLEWTGKKASYDLGSEEPASVIVTVVNDGNSSYDSCLLAHVDGAQIYNKNYEYRFNDGVEYTKFYLPSPLGRHNKKTIIIDLDMEGGTSLYTKLYVDVKLYENCGQLHFTEFVKTTSLTIPYNLVTDRVNVVGIQDYSKFTDQELQDHDMKYTPFIYDAHEYVINNHESITWKDIKAVLKVEKKTFLDEVEVLIKGNERGADECSREDLGTFYSFTCPFDLEAKNRKSIFATMNITKKNIMDHVVDEKFNSTSYLELHLAPTNIVKKSSSTTTFVFYKELSFGNDINMIILMAVLVAFVILTIIILILYKLNFFKRKDKKDLRVLRESIRRHSIKKSTSSSKPKDSVIDDAAIMDLVIEEDPFDEPATIQEQLNPEPAETTDDGVVLIQERVQVHC